MDSPLEVIKFTTTTTATATADSTTSSQESPVTNFIRNLSPIKNIRCANFAQAYLSLYSPTQVFTSPHTSSHRETSFPQRPQCFSLLLVETTQYDYESNKYDNGLDDSTETTSCLSSGLINQKDMDTKNSLPGHSNSSSGDVDEYLVDPVEVDHANSAYSASSKLEQSDGLLPSTESKNDLMSDGNDAWKEVDAPLPFKEQFGEDFPGKKFGVEAVKIVEGQKFGESLSIEYPDIESALSLDNISKEQQFEISGVQNVGGSNQDKFDRPSQLLHEQKQIVLTLEDHGGSARASTGGPAENAMHHVNEASQNQHSISRRCLQFGEAQPKSTLSSISSFNLQNNVTSTRQPLSAMQLESSEASHVDSSTTSSKRLLVSLSQPMSTMVPPRHRGNVPFAISKPSGIGLHLNSIVNNVPVGYSAIVRIKSADNSMGGLGMRSASGASCFFPENIKSCSGSSSLVEKVSDINEDMMFRREASIAAGSPPTEALHPMKPLKTLPPVEHNATPLSKMKVNVEHAHNFEEIKQPSPSKKRKKSSSTLDGEGCKCCNCKKTKCLKLYCDCFAAGIYCAEPCSCQGCFNRPEYEETVLETRQQIKSRNPLAFSPKIVQRVTEFPSNNAEEGNWSTPSSARHKKGCNCKKSMCLKKYCECYQANVGCSSGCRCEGCKNVYGKKEEYGLSEEMMINRGTEERLAETFDGRLEVVATEQDFLLAELYDSHHRTPLTPSYRGSKYLPSSESDLTILSSYAKPVRSVQNSDSNDIFLETSKGIIDVNSYGQETDYNSSQMGDRFSPRCDSLVDMSNLTPLSNPSMVMSSASSKTMDWTNASRFQPGTGSSCYPSDGSLRWRCSPISPMTQLRGTKDHERVDTDSRHYDILEDDTPDDTYDIFLETSKGILDVNSYGQETDYNSSQMGDRFSPRCDSLVDMSKSNLTPLPNPSMAMSSASSKTMDWTNASRLQPGTGSSCYPSDGSLRWRCSPISPMTQLCGAKDHERVDTDSRYYDILEDDTPEILKDAFTPNKSVKVSSPNQKRVSLPHTHMQELGSSSSGGGLKSRRKFILQAMPSFPPLTPCIDSKGSTNQKQSDV